MANLLYGIHDRDSHPLIPAGGWCIDAVLATDEPPNYAAIRNDINWIIRLNHGWNPNGTIPLRSGYAEYAKRCADFVGRVKGATRFIISNEPNHSQEYPHGVKIEPGDYADCFNQCYQAIKAVSPSADVLVAAIAPWDITGGMDWLIYYARMLDGIQEADGLAIHGYTHGPHSDLVWDMSKSHGWYWHFPVVYQTIEAIPAKFKNLPVHITETNQGDNAWANVNSGWVQEAYNSVEGHNGLENSQKIHSLSLYRWRGDKWEIYNKQGVFDDFQKAVAKGYESPSGEMPQLPDLPKPEPPHPADEERDIDPRLLARGVTFEFATPSAGTGYWRIVAARWLDEAEADRIGPDHHILGTIKRKDSEVADVPFLVQWPSGNTTIFSKADQISIPYNYDFPMSASLNEFAIQVADHKPSDKVSGIGMGAHGNPNIHTSTWVEYQWAIADSIEQPEPPTLPGIPKGTLLWPVNGPVSDDFGTPPSRFGQIGHNGIDIAVSLNTPVLSIADGLVVYVGEDVSYGNYCRVWHSQYNCQSFYAHLNSIAVRVGQRVNRGELLALSGSTGNSTGPHLHYELRAVDDNGNYVDVTYGYTKGRFNPKDAYLITGSPLSP